VPVKKGVDGWVSGLVTILQTAIAMQPGGSQIQFWMDHSLEPQRQVDDELRHKIRESKVILAFLSPRYLESEWCQREMRTFVDLVGGGVSANRVFLVEVRPTGRNQWHSGLQGLSPIEFWASTLADPEAMPLGWPVPNAEGDRDYWSKINSLASILARQIKGLPPEPPSQTQAATQPPDALPLPPANAASRTVWIADPTDDVVEDWESLRDFLRGRGHSVLPDQAGTYPFKDEHLLRQALEGDLQEADLLLQLLGALPGRKLAWASDRIAPLQAAFAQRFAESRKLDFLIWRNPAIVLDSIGDPVHRALLAGASETDMAAFLRRVLALLAPQPKSGPSSGQPLSVVINADQPDRDLGKQAQDILGELEVYATLAAQPLPTQPPAEYRQHLEAQLHNSNGVLIVYGVAPLSWVQVQHAQARKVLAQARKGIWGGLLDGPPEVKPEHGLPPRNLMMLDCRQGLCRAPLDRFVQALRASSHV
jgi:TIR domain-containing protein